MLPRSAVSRGTSANVARRTERTSRCSSPSSSNREEIRGLGRAHAPSRRATSPDRLLTGPSQTIGKRLVALPSAPASSPSSCQSRTRRRSAQRLDGRRSAASPRLARSRTRANCGVWACFLVSRGVETACNSSGCSGTPFAGEAVFVAPTFPQDPASCLRAWRGRSVDTESPCRPRLMSSPTLGAPYGLPRPLRVCYGLSAAIGGTGSRRGIRRATRVQLGIHQLASPSSRIRAGTSSARMTVASRMIPAARPIASGLTS